MINKIKQDLNMAMKDQNKILLQVLREVKTKYDQQLKSGNDDLDIILLAMAKQRQQSIEAIKNSLVNEQNQTKLVTRQNQLNKEKTELEIIKSYLPKQLNKNEIESIVCGIIEKNTNIGAIMKEFKITYPKEDMKIVSSIVRNLLI